MNGRDTAYDQAEDSQADEMNESQSVQWVIDLLYSLTPLCGKFLILGMKVERILKLLTQFFALSHPVFLERCSTI